MGFWNWFKKKQQEAEGISMQVPEANTDEVVVSDHRITQEDSNEPEKRPPFKIKALLTNRTLTVYLPSGDIVSNTDAEKELYFKVIASVSEQEVHDLMIPRVNKEEKKIDDNMKEFIKKEREEAEKKKKKKEIAFKEDQELGQEISSIEETGEFKMKNKLLYMKGIDIAIPKLLAKELLKSGKTGDEELYNSLKNFWRWAVLNPDPVAREDIFAFLEGSDFKITSGGMFLAYRRVKRVNEGKGKDKDLTAFISSAYLKVKGQKKSPKNFYVLKSDEGYTLVKNTDNFAGNLGQLNELYTNLSSIEDNEFTDNHTKTMKILIGTEVTMPREDCDHDPSSSCSRGLHAMSKQYNQTIGDTLILVAINPMNVVAVPKYEKHKLRCCAYMPLAIIDSWVLEDSDFNTLSLQEEYFGDQVDKLEALVANSSPKELSAGKEITPMEVPVLQGIMEQLEVAKADLSKRVVTVK